MGIKEFHTLALSFPGTAESPHFDKVAYKVIDKRIYATLDEKLKIANLKLSPQEQKSFCTYGPDSVYPVQNKWGLQGWTTFDLNKVTHELMQEALDSAYQLVFKKNEKGGAKRK